MASENVTLYMAFTGGVLSFISPCVLPLIPSYVTYISGISLEDLAGGSPGGQVRKTVLLNSLAFVAGFSVVFIAMGATISLLGQFFADHRDSLRKIGAVIIVIMGIHIMGIVNIKWLQKERRLDLFRSKPLGYTGSFMVGIGFGAGWTPCIGPILAAILILAGASESFGLGLQLLLVYSLGLALPFLLTSVGINRFLRLFDRFKRHLRTVSVLSGLFLVGMGVLIYSNYFAIFTGYLNAWFPFLIYN